MYQERVGDIGQDVAEEDEGIGGAVGHRPLDERLFAQTEDFTSGDAHLLGDLHKPDGQGGDLQ